MIIEVHVLPNSKKQEIKKISEREYRISLKEKADKNKANIALLKLLKKHFGSEVKIIKGLKSKNKFIKLE